MSPTSTSTISTEFLLQNKCGEVWFPSREIWHIAQSANVFLKSATIPQLGEEPFCIIHHKDRFFTLLRYGCALLKDVSDLRSMPYFSAHEPNFPAFITYSYFWEIYFFSAIQYFCAAMGWCRKIHTRPTFTLSKNWLKIQMQIFRVIIK